MRSHRNRESWLLPAIASALLASACGADGSPNTVTNAAGGGTGAAGSPPVSGLGGASGTPSPGGIGGSGGD